MQDKKPKNAQGLKHGRWEIYYCHNLWRIVNYINGVECGYRLHIFYSDETKIEMYYAR
jgi:hypothetical protein